MQPFSTSFVYSFCEVTLSLTTDLYAVYMEITVVSEIYK